MGRGSLQGFWAVLRVVLLLSAQAPAAFGLSGDDNDAAQEASDHLYKVVWTYTPQPGLVQDGYIRVPLPVQHAPYQSARYEVTGARSHKTGSENGNEFLLVAPDGDNEFTVTALVTVRPYSYGAQLAQAAKTTPASVPPDVLPYLGATDRINPQSPKIQALAAPLRGDTPVATIKNVIAYLNRAMHYDLRKASFTDVEQVAERGAGDCGCYAALFVALCRANDIPAREVWGLSLSRDRRFRRPGTTGREWLGNHMWADVYLPGAGWIPVEPQSTGGIRLPGIGAIRLAHFDPARGNYLHTNASAMGAHPPAFKNLTSKAAPVAARARRSG